jgi:hypothetical protein
MKLTKIAALFAVPVIALAAQGCASGSSDDTNTGDGAFTAGAGADFSAAVGAVVVEGVKVCTAAVVDVDANAKIGPVSAKGRQIVMGGACIGKLKNGFEGAAVFVSQQNGLSISTPILSIDFESQAAAGLAVGILSNQVQGTQALPFIGVQAAVDAGAHVGTVLQADENGLLVGASAEFHAGVDFALKTQCTSLSFSAHVGAAVGASFAAGPDGVGAAFLVKINGQLHFAAHIDGQCVVRHFEKDVAAVADATLKAANDIGDALNSLGEGQVIGVARTKDRNTEVKIKLYSDSKAIRINGQGHISASGGGATCDKIPLLFLGGPCELRPAAGFKKGSMLDLQIDTHENLLPDGPDGMRLVISTSNDPPAQSSNDTPASN